MGNFVSCRTLDAGGGKVVLFDGTIHEFDRPISVAELMLEHPRQFVVDMQSLSAGATKVTPLPADHTLDTNKIYLMLPMTRRKVSADEARRILSLARSVLRSRSLPFWAKNHGLVPGICMEGVGEKEKAVPAGRKDDSLMEREEAGGAEESPEVFGARSEFLGRTVSGKGWKPSLRTIEEKALERKVSHWLF
ncbi:uncharacterized protein LOC103704729 [Phoenix dactylifera]|uniref:Uncharacterized protein LOC103704729 n=1 Tax=Phoenix dactylifera TaxID=42345 RepID=A0A8B7BVN2_PHODC|nr:uncharacterized protein LOC103704729 [Phoenix dactylifera]